MYSVFDKILDNKSFPSTRWFNEYYVDERSGYEVYKKDGNLHLNINAAGFKKEDFDIYLDDGAINIKVYHGKEEEKDIEWIIRNTEKEITYSYTLPMDVDENKITASYEAGVLKIKAPMSEETKPKKIMIEW